MSTSKDLTIILSCYGADTLIEGYVASLLENRYLYRFQVVVVNIVPSHKDPAFVQAQIQRLTKHVTLINLDRNITLYEAWNLGIQRATTEFVSNLNLDDRVAADYYEIGVHALRQHQADVFSSNSITTSRIGNWTQSPRQERHLPDARFATETVVSYGVEDLIYLDGNLNVKKNSVPHCCPIWRRSIHDEYGFFDCRAFDFCADFAFWARAVSGGAQFIHHNDFLTLFYIGAGSVSDRLIHADSAKLVDKWTPAFEAQSHVTSELGRKHDLLHYALNHEIIFSDRRFHAHLAQRVSLCIASHTVNDYLVKALRSVMAQSYQNFELVLVLDGHQETQEIERIRFATSDVRVKLMINQSRLERSISRNMAMAASSGTWIMLMDSDDMLEKNAMKALLRASLASPDKVWYGNEILIDEDDQPIQEINYGKAYDLQAIKYSWPSHANTLWPASFVRGARYPATYTDPDIPSEHLAGEDVEFMVSILQANPGILMNNCGVPTYYWRRHQSSSYRRRHVSIFSVLGRLIRLFPDALSEEKFCCKLAERFFNCFVWYVIDAALLGKADHQFLVEFTRLLRDRPQNKVFEEFRKIVNDDRIKRDVAQQFAVNKSILARTDATVVQSMALVAFRSLMEDERSAATAAPSPSIKRTTVPAIPSPQPVQKRTMSPNYQRINRFFNYHRGQECILMCNGPSLRKIDFSRVDRERFVLFGLNKVFLAEDFMGPMPRYIAAVNAKVIEQSAETYAHLRAVKFLSNRYFSPLLEEDPLTYFINTKFNPTPEPRFSYDVGAFVNEGWTVTHVAFQIIYHMGFKSVYVVGLDHRFSLGIKGKENTEGVIEGNDPDHFHPKYFGGGQKWDLPDLVNSEISYRAALEAFGKAGRSIINCTPGTACDIFPLAPPDVLYRQGKQ